MRALVLLLAPLAVACGGAPPVSMTCRAVSDPAVPGSPVSAAIELHNDTDGTITILGMTVPWLFRHAAHFAAPGFEDPHVIADPAEYEPVLLFAGESTGGEVPLRERLVDSFGRSIDEMPGTHEVEVRARLTLDPDTDRRRNTEARCSFVVDVAEPAAGP